MLGSGVTERYLGMTGDQRQECWGVLGRDKEMGREDN